MNGGGEAGGGLPKVKREFHINLDGQGGKKCPIFWHNVASSLLPRSEGRRKWCRQAREMRAWTAFHNSALATWKSRTDRFLKGQIRPNLKGIFVDSSVNDLSKDLKIKGGYQLTQISFIQFLFPTVFLEKFQWEKKKKKDMVKFNDVDVKKWFLKYIFNYANKRVKDHRFLWTLSFQNTYLFCLKTMAHFLSFSMDA